MEDFLYFFSLQDANVRHVVLGCLLLGIISAWIGGFAFLRKQALVGDAVAHALLPGVCLAFLWSGEKNFAFLLIGAMATGLLALICMQYLLKSKLKQDTVIALVLSVFFGVGILLLTYIRQSGNAAQSGLDSFLFGKAAALLSTDVWLFFGLGGLLVGVMALFFKEFALLCFDELFARSLGLPVAWLKALLTALTLLCIVLGIQAVGVVMVAALLITPAAAARFWSARLGDWLWLAVAFGGLAGVAGSYVSYVIPQMPTGPWIVLILSGVAVFSFLFAPRKGIWAKTWRARRDRRAAHEENILKTFYQLREEDPHLGEFVGVEQLQQRRSFSSTVLRKGCRRLLRKGLLSLAKDRSVAEWCLTTSGLREAKSVVRRHRLWELYLSRHLHVSLDQVHEKAERVEHALSDELSEELDELLGHPSSDPHRRHIPIDREGREGNSPSQDTQVGPRRGSRPMDRKQQEDEKTT